MTIRVNLTTVFPGVVLFLLGLLVLIGCGFAFLIWLFLRFDFSGVLIALILGLLLLGSGLYLIFTGISFWSLVRMR